MGNALLFPGFVVLTAGTGPKRPFMTPRRHLEETASFAVHIIMGIKSLIIIFIRKNVYKGVVFERSTHMYVDL
jgi:hypothetical protein